jgi:tetratricopeptide (TPR) repeat protein
MAPFATAALPQLYELKGALEPRGPADLSAHTYDGAFARAEAAARSWGAMLERERQEARAKVPEMLAQQTADGRGLALRREPDFWTLGLVEELLTRSRELRHESPAATVQYAELAKLAAENLAPDRYGACRVEDARARSWAELGNAYRIADELAQADEAFAHAERHRKAGTGDPLLAASIADLTASLRCHQRHFGEAFRLLDRAYVLYVDHGDRHRGGRALISKGIYTGYSGEPEEALWLLGRGLTMIDRRREPALLPQALHAILWFKIDLGEYSLVRSLLRELPWLYKRDGGKMDFLKLRWLEGKAAAGMGDLSAAETAFTEVRAGMTKDGLTYHAALAGLDLAAAWFRQGRIGAIPPLVEEMIAAFKAQDIKREALAALLLLRDASRQQALSLELIQRVSALLTRLERFGIQRLEEGVSRNAGGERPSL